VFGADLGTFFGSRGDEGAAGQVVGLAEEPSRALMDRRNRLFAEGRVIQPSQVEVVVEIILHALAVDTFQVAPGDDAGGKGQRSSPVEFIEEIILSGQEEGKEGFGISFKLRQGMQFGKDFEAEKRGFIDEENDLLPFSQG
jgi:hypothetical protein